ncbi:MAG: type IV toxin-antitoxin system AbiEi family antitoxin domain-containing protein [Myxococcaceae bacterium]
MRDSLKGLPATFGYSEARKAGLTKWRIYRFRDEGRLTTIGRGLYRQASAEETVNLELIAAAHRAPKATLCLATALAEHGLTDAIPSASDIALPNNIWIPKLDLPIAWHRFDPRTFEIGREPFRLDQDTSIGIYRPERSIVDAFRMSGHEGRELGREALRRWLRRRGSSPAKLLKVAKSFPRSMASLTSALEVLQ